MLKVYILLLLLIVEVNNQKEILKTFFISMITRKYSQSTNLH